MLLLYSTVDEFVMSNLMNYGGKSLLSAENAKLDLDAPTAADALGEAEAEGLKGWLVEKVGGVKEVRRAKPPPATPPPAAAALRRRRRARALM